MCVWIVWNERNNRIFKNIQTTMIDLMEKVKYNSFWWLKANNANLFMARLDGGRTHYFVWVSANLFYCNYTVTVCSLGYFFGTPYAKEDSSPLLIYFIFYS